MAKHTLDNARVAVNSVDLSDHVRSVTVNTARPEIDVTSMGATNQQIVLGIGTASIEVEFFNDYAAGEVYATLDPLSSTDTPFPVAVRPENTTIGSTNPEFQLAGALLPDWTPLSGTVGEANMVTARFVNADPTGLVRDTSP